MIGQKLGTSDDGKQKSKGTFVLTAIPNRLTDAPEKVAEHLRQEQLDSLFSQRGGGMSPGKEGKGNPGISGGFAGVFTSRLPQRELHHQRVPSALRRCSLRNTSPVPL